MNAETKTDADALLKQFEPKQKRMINPSGQLCIARISPCGKFIVGGGFLGKTHRWDISQELADPKAETPEAAPVEGHHGWISGLAFHPTGDVVFTADSWGELRCWPYAAEKPEPKWSVAAAHDGWIQALAVSPDGKLVATAGNDQRVRIWNAEDGKPVQELVHDAAVLSVQFHPDGKSLVAGDFMGATRQWDLASGKVVREFDTKAFSALHRLQDVGGVKCLAFDSEGKTLACGGTQPANGGTVQGAPTVKLFDWATGKETASLELGDKSDCYVHEMAFHQAGFLMAVTSGTPGRGKLVFWKLGDEKPFFETKTMQNCHSLSPRGDGFGLAVVSTSRGSNGNGRKLDKDGNYAGNFSPIHILEMPREEAKAS